MQPKDPDAGSESTANEAPPGGAEVINFDKLALALGQRDLAIIQLEGRVEKLTSDVERLTRLASTMAEPPVVDVEEPEKT